MAALFCTGCKKGFRSHIEARAQGWTGSAFSRGDRCPECDAGTLKHTYVALEMMLAGAIELNLNQAQRIRELEESQDDADDAGAED